jgi:hypothetical protein
MDRHLDSSTWRGWSLPIGCGVDHGSREDLTTSLGFRAPTVDRVPRGSEATRLRLGSSNYGLARGTGAWHRARPHRVLAHLLQRSSSDRRSVLGGEDPGSAFTAITQLGTESA